MTQSLKNNILAWLVLLTGCNNRPGSLPLPFINQPDCTPEWINPTDSNYSIIHQIPDFSSTDQDSATITEKTV
jgi:hypothetical protein